MAKKYGDQYNRDLKNTESVIKSGNNELKAEKAAFDPDSLEAALNPAIRVLKKRADDQKEELAKFQEEVGQKGTDQFKKDMAALEVALKKRLFDLSRSVGNFEKDLNNLQSHIFDSQNYEEAFVKEVKSRLEAGDDLSFREDQDIEDAGGEENFFGPKSDAQQMLDELDGNPSLFEILENVGGDYSTILDSEIITDILDHVNESSTDKNKEYAFQALKYAAEEGAISIEDITDYDYITILELGSYYRETKLGQFQDSIDAVDLFFNYAESGEEERELDFLEKQLRREAEDEEDPREFIIPEEYIQTILDYVDASAEKFELSVESGSRYRVTFRILSSILNLKLKEGPTGLAPRIGNIKEGTYINALVAFKDNVDETVEILKKTDIISGRGNSVFGGGVYTRIENIVKIPSLKLDMGKMIDTIEERFRLLINTDSKKTQLDLALIKSVLDANIADKKQIRRIIGYFNNQATISAADKKRQEELKDFGLDRV